MQLTFSILSWGAWSPDYQQRQDWQQWQQANGATPVHTAVPPLQQVPSMQKRRLSRLTKMMLEAAFMAQPQPDCRSVFASRHGELHRTITLLEEMLQQQPLSPMGFSQSVHNTASGVFGILTQDQAPSTSIAAGRNTLSQALVETWTLLVEDSKPVLLVFGDDPVPQVYQDFVNEPEYPLALALVLAPETCAGIASLTLDTHHQDTSSLCYGQLLQSLATCRATAGQLAGMYWQLRPREGAC
ncbi:beta-ketoacyl synthase chain length factor [Shewanella yunxiaonensis]|uniref:Beta-ketoacyl synthase chain length factor n=1 Tax=Shewanella yunxiaonensis TaxID=2829809 RepID=A0ABX7YZI9_9GAMM|nr:beta-ketoacyl synthase chain length factor [Shewanella yunxiaonensis]QUN07700.1 beta-ketoacyl synthase chain length factor [Shewanella yunxiaonensis]